jgi:hypothetical protein
VCEREPVGATAHPCNGGVCMSVRSGKHYLYVGTKVWPKDAFLACKNVGATLAVFETHEEREALARELLSFLPKSPSPQIWIGLTRAANEVSDASLDGWTWADGKPVTGYPLEWANQQPSRGQWAYMQFSFTGVYDTQLVVSDDGTQRLPYLCQL